MHLNIFYIINYACSRHPYIALVKIKLQSAKISKNNTKTKPQIMTKSTKRRFEPFPHKLRHHRLKM